MNSNDRKVVFGIFLAVVCMVIGGLFFGAPRYQVLAYPDSLSLRKVEGVEPHGDTVTGYPVLMAGADSAGVLRRLAVDAAGNMLTKRSSAIIEQGMAELIGINEVLTGTRWTQSITATLATTGSGTIVDVVLAISGTLSEAGDLVFFDQDPNTPLSTTALTAEEWPYVIGIVSVAAADWIEDNSGVGGAVYKDVNIEYHDLRDLFVGYYHRGSTEWNDSDTDNESLQANFWYRIES